MSGPRVVLLAKERHASEPTFQRFVALGAARGHDLRWRDKQTFLAGDLARVDVVCLKCHLDDFRVWQAIEAHGVRALNRRAACAACGERSRLDPLLRNGGARTPRSASNAAEVERLSYPIVRKPNASSAARDVCVLGEPPSRVDCRRCFYQERVAGDGNVYKVYCIGTETFLVREPDAGALRSARRQALPMPSRLADAALQVGRLTGLEVFGLDFMGAPPDEMVLIDVNPFPSFRCLPRAADALWDHLEKIAPGGVA